MFQRPPGFTMAVDAADKKSKFLLYNFIKIWVRLGLLFYCRKIQFNNPAVLKSKGPLLLACNHPNSFLDAIIIGSHFNQPVHFLARGDAFRKPLVRKILTALKMIPIYRLSEGREYLALNDATFDKCHDILCSGGIVLIFAEGLCVNQCALRPLKKGAARIAWNAVNDPAVKDDFRVIPVGINYNGFGQPGKRVLIQFADPLTMINKALPASQADFIQQFNSALYTSLENATLTDTSNRRNTAPLLISNYHNDLSETDPISVLKQQQQLMVSQNMKAGLEKLIQPGLTALTSLQLVLRLLAYMILMLPAIIGWIMHVILFYPLNKYVKRKTKGTVFYDSVLFGALLLSYPLYWMILNCISIVFIQSPVVRCMIAMLPLFAWIYLIWLDCATAVGNYYLLPRATRKALAKTI